MLPWVLSLVIPLVPLWKLSYWCVLKSLDFITPNLSKIVLTQFSELLACTSFPRHQVDQIFKNLF